MGGSDVGDDGLEDDIAGGDIDTGYSKILPVLQLDRTAVAGGGPRARECHYRVGTGLRLGLAAGGDTLGCIRPGPMGLTLLSGAASVGRRGTMPGAVG